MKKGDVGMANRFSKKYGNKGWALNYLKDTLYQQSDATSLLSLPQECKQPMPDMLTVPNITASSILYKLRVWLNALHMTVPSPHEAGKVTTLAECKGNGIYLRNPLTQGWLQAS